MTTSTSSQFSPSYETIKLGIDAYAKYYWVRGGADSGARAKRPLDGRGRQKDRKLLFNPRHDFFSLDAGALNNQAPMVQCQLAGYQSV